MYIQKGRSSKFKELVNLVQTLEENVEVVKSIWCMEILLFTYSLIAKKPVIKAILPTRTCLINITAACPGYDGEDYPLPNTHSGNQD